MDAQAPQPEGRMPWSRFAKYAARWLPHPASAIPIPSCDSPSPPKARAGCGNAACPDPVEGVMGDHEFLLRLLCSQSSLLRTRRANRTMRLAIRAARGEPSPRATGTRPMASTAFFNGTPHAGAGGWARTGHSPQAGRGPQHPARPATVPIEARTGRHRPSATGSLGLFRPPRERRRRRDRLRPTV